MTETEVEQVLVKAGFVPGKGHKREGFRVYREKGRIAVIWQSPGKDVQVTRDAMLAAYEVALRGKCKVRRTGNRLEVEQ